MLLPIIGVVLLAIGAAGIVTGFLPWSDVVDISERVAPVLLFVIAATIVAELAAKAGVFDVAAAAVASIARGRRFVLWLLVIALTTVVTAFLSIDTTAVLLTPVVVVLARTHGLPPLPFAMVTVWLANTASLFLPVSNLTSLLAAGRIAADASGFLALLIGSALVAVVVSAAMLTLVFRRDLRGALDPAAPAAIRDRPRLIAAGAIVAVMLPFFVTGVAPAVPASLAAVALLVLFAVRSPRELRRVGLPWRIVVFACGLFLAVALLERAGIGSVTAAVTGGGDDLFALWRMSGVGLLAANAFDNLPAYLLLEGAADAPVRLAALLVGVNAGALITPWASLATLLWHDRLAASGVRVSWWRYAVLGLIGAPLTVAVATIPLAFH